MPNEPKPSLRGITLGEGLFTKTRGERCRLSECRAGCCSNGVWMDSDHVDLLLKHRAEISARLPPERRDPLRWFEEEREDKDFPSGTAVSSACAPVPGEERETCVFLLPDYRCVLQVSSEALGLPGLGLKPFYCALYPLLLSDGALDLDHQSPEELGGADCQRPSADPKPVIEVFEYELRLALGDGYEELCAIAKARK
jgi:hypothetical protein